MLDAASARTGEAEQQARLRLSRRSAGQVEPCPRGRELREEALVALRLPHQALRELGEHEVTPFIRLFEEAQLHAQILSVVAIGGHSFPHSQLHPVVLPQVSHLMQVPLRTSVKFAHSGQASPT